MSARCAIAPASALCGRALAVALAVCSDTTVFAQAKPATAASNPSARSAASANADQGATWASLKPAQREALKPLERDWASIDSSRKRKWLEIADRYPSMPQENQARLQARMAEWARLTPLERGQVRLNYQKAKQVPVQDRQASWEAYQALPPEQRRELADRAMLGSSGANRQNKANPKVTRAGPDKLAAEGPQPKSNTVPDPALAGSPRPVAATVAKARPGATTTVISKPVAPPTHQQTGMPKIAATQEYIDSKTLLPQTGAQSAMPRPASASTASTRP